VRTNEVVVSSVSREAEGRSKAALLLGGEVVLLAFRLLVNVYMHRHSATTMPWLRAVQRTYYMVPGAQAPIARTA